MVKKNFLKSSLIIIVAIAMILIGMPRISLAAVETDKPVFTYKAHVQTYGWKGDVVSSTTLADKPTTFAGTSGEAKRVEGLNIRFASTDENVTVTYRAHVQTDGWQDPKTAKNGETVFIGTEGQSKRIEAIQINVKGLTGYKVLYRAHVQTYGWQDWVDASTDGFAGTSGERKRIEAIEIAVVKADDLNYTPTQNGTHLVTYKGKTVSTQKCALSAWTQNLNVTDKTGNATDTFTRECPLCHGNKQKTTLTTLLAESLKNNGDGVVRVEDLDLDQLYEKVEVKAGNTLVVEGNLAGHNAIGNNVANPTPGGGVVNPLITNKGTIKLNGTIASNFNNAYIVNVENGTTVWNHVFTTASELENSATYTSDGKNVVQKYLTEIKLADGSVDQTLTTGISVDSKLTLDLNGKKLTDNGKVAKTVTLTNKNNLSIKNGTLENSSKSVLIDSTATDAKLTLENVKVVSNGSGIKSNGKLQITGGSVTAGTGDNYAGILITSSTVNSAILTNVAITSPLYGIMMTGHSALTITGGTINVTGNGGYAYAIYSEAVVGNLIVKETKITSAKYGIYLDSNEKTDSSKGNLAILTDVTITSENTCLSAGQSGDRFQVVGGNYISNSNKAVDLAANTSLVSTFKDCTLSGSPIINAPKGNYTFTNVH